MVLEKNETVVNRIYNMFKNKDNEIKVEKDKDFLKKNNDVIKKYIMLKNKYNEKKKEKSNNLVEDLKQKENEREIQKFIKDHLDIINEYDNLKEKQTQKQTQNKNTKNYITSFGIEIILFLLLFIFSIIFYIYYNKDPFKLISNYKTAIISFILIITILIFYFNLNTIFNLENINYNFEIFKHIYILIFFITIVFYIYKYFTYYDKFEISSYFKMPFLILVISFIIYLCLLILTFIKFKSFVSNDGKSKEKLFKETINYFTNLMKYFLLIGIPLTFIILLIQSLVYFILNSNNSLNGTVKFIINAIVIIFIVGIILKYFVLKDKNIINKLPKLNIDIDYNQNKEFFKVLLGVILLYLIYFIVYPRIRSLIEKNYLQEGGLLLLNQPIYTNKENILATYNQLNTNYKDENNTITSYDYTFCISFWFYIDSEAPSTSSSYNKYTSILSYGNKPSVLYNPSINTLLITMGTQGLTDEELNILKNNKNVDLDDNNNIIIYKKTDILLQKWNNIVINYNGGTLDIFFDTILLKSYSGVIPYMNYDTLLVGEEKGVRGGICSVLYFSKNLDLQKIRNLFYFVKDYTPPVYSNSNKTIMNKL